MIWLLPAVLAAVLALPVAVSSRAAAREAAALRRELGAMATLGDALAELRTEARVVAAGMPALHLRARPGPPSAP